MTTNMRLMLLAPLDTLVSSGLWSGPHISPTVKFLKNMFKQSPKDSAKNYVVYMPSDLWLLKVSAGQTSHKEPSQERACVLSTRRHIGSRRRSQAPKCWSSNT